MIKNSLGGSYIQWIKMSKVFDPRTPFSIRRFVSGMVHTGVKVYKMDSEICRLVNDLGFSLCATPSVYHVVVISRNRKKSEMGVSTNLVCCYWILEIEFNKKLSSSIIRLVDYSVTTMLQTQDLRVDQEKESLY